MTDQAEPGRPPAHDLAAFDLSKQSAEQIAQSFARWKAQRKPPPRKEPPPTAVAPAATDGTRNPAPASAQKTGLRAATARRAGPVRYSTTFSALLAAGSEPAVARDAWAPLAPLPAPKRNPPPRGRRLQLMSVLVGIASVLAVAAGVLVEQPDRPAPTEAKPEVARAHPVEIPPAEHLLPAATTMPEWKLQRTVDLELMKPAPVKPAAPPASRPATPAVRTASTGAPSSTADKPAQPAPKSVAPEIEQFVAKPFVPSAAPVPAIKQAAKPVTPPAAAAVRAGDPRPDDLVQHGRDNNKDASRIASGSQPAAKSAGGAEARPASARGGAAASGGGDPRGEGTGGARIGVSGETGGDISGAAASDTDDAGDAPDDDGATGSGSTADDGGDAAGVDAGSDDAGGNPDGDDSGEGESSSSGSGDGDPSSGGDSSSGEDGESNGIGGVIGGALEGVGDALGDALGSANGNPDSNDQDRRN